MNPPVQTLHPTRLAAIRVKEGRTLASMALDIGVPVNRYKPWHYGHAKPQDLETRQRLIQKFKVSFDELFAPAVLKEDGTITRLGQ